jgi:hypothetical protein
VVLVISRWVPHSTRGRRGTSAAAAIRAAPVLRSLISIAREMVASGKMPTTSPRSRNSCATVRERSPSARVDLDVAAGLMIGPGQPVVEELALGHEPRPATHLVDGDPGVDEVDVADVVDRDQGAAGLRHVLDPVRVIFWPSSPETELGRAG